MMDAVLNWLEAVLSSHVAILAGVACLFSLAVIGWVIAMWTRP